MLNTSYCIIRSGNGCDTFGYCILDEQYYGNKITKAEDILWEKFREPIDNCFEAYAVWKTDKDADGKHKFYLHTQRIAITLRPDGNFIATMYGPSSNEAKEKFRYHDTCLENLVVNLDTLMDKGKYVYSPDKMFNNDSISFYLDKNLFKNDLFQCLCSELNDTFRREVEKERRYQKELLTLKQGHTLSYNTKLTDQTLPTIESFKKEDDTWWPSK